MWQSLSAIKALQVGAVALALSLVGVFTGPETSTTQAELHLSFFENPIVKKDETFTIAVDATAVVPTNVFAGEIVFEESAFDVVSIDYNISLVDLWAEKPWYAEGGGVISFAGGTTMSGGFVGTEHLLQVTFRAKGVGEHSIGLENVQVLLHDGLGTEAVLAGKIDTIVTVESAEIAGAPQETEAKEIVVVETEKSADLNGDGSVTFLDTSIFMQHFATQNLQSDFNNDGKVGWRDYSIFSKLK